MSTTRWFVKNKIIITDFIGDISLDDLKESGMKVMELLEQSDSPLVHLLTNETYLLSLPSSIKEISESSPFMQHPQMGWMIMYGSEDRLAKFKAAIVTGIVKTRHRRFLTLSESLDFLVAMDKSLPSIEEMINQ